MHVVCFCDVLVLMLCVCVIVACDGVMSSGSALVCSAVGLCIVSCYVAVVCVCYVCLCCVVCMCCVYVMSSLCGVSRVYNVSLAAVCVWSYHSCRV